MHGRIPVLFCWLALVLTPLLPATAAVPRVQVEPAEVAPGTPLRITVTGVPAAVRPTGHFLEAPLVFLPGEQGAWVAFAGVDLDVAPGSYELRLLARGQSLLPRQPMVQVAPRDYPTEALKVAPKYVDPPPAVSARIAREAKSLQALWDRAVPEKLFNGAVVRPLPDAAGRNFGRRRVFNGQPRSPHSGTDLSAPTGTPVPASARGRVVMAEELYFSGNLVVMEHGGGVYTLYAHLSAMDVKEGDLVEAGETIGRVGATGRVTGAHLHWGARIGAARVDPALLLDLLQRP